MDGSIKPIIEATNIASPQEIIDNKKLLRRTVGFAGYMTRMEMRSKLGNHPTLVDSLLEPPNKNKKSLVQVYSNKNETLYIRSIDTKSGGFVAKGHALAKQAIIKPKQLSRIIKLKRRMKQTDGSISQGVRGRAYYSTTKGAASTYSDLANFKSVTIYQKKVHTKGKNKGKEYWSRKSIKVFEGWKDQKEVPTFIRFLLKDGRYRSALETQIATRPESLHWKNWIQNYGLEGLSASRCTNAIHNYLQDRLDEMTKD